MKEYKRRNRDKLLALRREEYRETHPPRLDTAWSVGHSDIRFCRSCGERAESKPLDGCSEPKHWYRHESRRERNNTYRREKRREAREAGSVYRKGRGRAENRSAYQRRIAADARAEIMRRLGQTSCVRCGFSDIRALQFDHRLGGGAQHRRSVGIGNAYLRALLAMPVEELQAQFQVLCANCNTIKKLENGEQNAKKTTAQTN